MTQKSQGPLRLSELMRQGSLLHPQAFGDYLVNGCCTCAMGAVYEAATGKLPPAEGSDSTACLRVVRAVKDETGVSLAYDMVIHPVTHVRDGLGAIISDLNDKRKWTREQIADWLESEEM